MVVRLERFAETLYVPKKMYKDQTKLEEVDNTRPVCRNSTSQRRWRTVPTKIYQRSLGCQTDLGLDPHGVVMLGPRYFQKRVLFSWKPRVPRGQGHDTPTCCTKNDNRINTINFFWSLLWINKAKTKKKMYMSVGVMKDYKLKLRKLRTSHTLGWPWNWNT